MMKWQGVMPAITTCFDKSLGIDHGFMAEHCRWLLDNGCTGIVALGSLGEGATLTFDEKLAVVRTCVRAGEHSNLHAVKESSADVRRITAIRALVGDDLELFIGVDDVIVEGVGAGAVGWIAGLVNALPRESVDLFNYAVEGDHEKAFELYRW